MPSRTGRAVVSCAHPDSSPRDHAVARGTHRRDQHRVSAIPHAFGGALALAYYAEPRATIDIDLNVFVPPDQFPAVAAPLVALGAEADDPSVAKQIQRAGKRV